MFGDLEGFVATHRRCGELIAARGEPEPEKLPDLGRLVLRGSIRLRALSSPAPAPPSPASPAPSPARWSRKAQHAGNAPSGALLGGGPETRCVLNVIDQRFRTLGRQQFQIV